MPLASCLLPLAFCSLFPVPCSLFPIPYSLKMSIYERKYYKVLRAVINAQHNAGQYFAEG
ncbi:MAG: hypothetical protein EAZ76_17470 [Nostocales cyanobacterium]|nr:MAG: hypothetical protein EAZ87_08840 [Nostocales cyanobacterium]TAF07842.1 MAG: hypothetical protein EAZ76_17470 [Nostocales cyanobacterium]